MSSSLFAGLPLSSLLLDFDQLHTAFVRGPGDAQLKPRPFLPFVTFTRASAATRVNESGLIESVGNNVPRLDHDPVTKQPRGLLIEGQRANLSTQSEFANGVTDAPTRGGLVTAATFSGLVGATGLAFGHDGSTSSFAYKTNFTFAGSTTYAFSVFVRMTDGLAPSFGEGSTTGPQNDFVLVVAGTGVAINNYQITNFGGGLFRVTAVTTTVASPASNNVGVVKHAGNSARTFTVSGYQLEVGAFASSYIPTAGSQVTRSADVATITGTNFSDWYRQDEGTFAVEASSFTVGEAQAVSFRNSGTALQNRNTLALGVGPLGGPGSVRAQVVSGGSVRIDTGSSAAFVQNQINRLAVAIAQNDYAFARNGAAPVAITTSPLPIGINLLEIGNRNNLLHLFGHIRRIQYWPQRLTNAQLQEITAPTSATPAEPKRTALLFRTRQWASISPGATSSGFSATNLSPWPVPRVGPSWRQPAANDGSIIIDMGADQEIDTAALFGISDGDNIPSAAGWEWQVNLATGAQGGAFNLGEFWSSGWLPFANTGQLPESLRAKQLWLAPQNAPAASRYVRFLFRGLNGASLQISLIALGKRFQPDRNYSFGAAFGVRDLGELDYSPRGVVLHRRGRKLRGMGLTFRAIRRDELEDQLQRLFEQVGNTDPVVLVSDPTPHLHLQNRMGIGHLTGNLGSIHRLPGVFQTEINFVAID